MGILNLGESLRVVHTQDETIRIERAGVTLLTYHYRPDVEQKETPKPFIHPLATPRGDVMTLDRPHDHVWHRGLFFGWSTVNDANFWGGPSFVCAEGYVQKANNGAMRHDAWETVETNEDGVLLQERLTWTDVNDAPWISERRTTRVHNPVDDDQLLLTIKTELVPLVGQGPFRFGSPLTEGRPAAGYSGLTLRLPRSLNGGRITLSTGDTGPDVMGRRGEWLHFSGKQDGTANPCGVAMFDHPTNPRFPTHFFVRNTPFGIINPAFCWDEEFLLEEGESLSLQYGVWLHSGDVEKEEVQRAYDDWANSAT